MQDELRLAEQKPHKPAQEIGRQEKDNSESKL